MCRVQIMKFKAKDLGIRSLGVAGDLIVKALDCRLRGLRFQSHLQQRYNYFSRGAGFFHVLWRGR